MVRTGIFDSNQHANKWCCEAEKSTEVHQYKIQSALYNNSPLFVWYGKNTSIHELRTFGCDIYPMSSSTKKLDDRTQ